MVWLNFINEFRACPTKYICEVNHNMGATDQLPAAERPPQNIFYEVHFNISFLLNHRRPVEDTGFKRKTIPGQHQRTSW